MQHHLRGRIGSPAAESAISRDHARAADAGGSLDASCNRPPDSNASTASEAANGYRSSNVLEIVPLGGASSTVALAAVIVAPFTHDVEVRRREQE